MGFKSATRLEESIDKSSFLKICEHFNIPVNDFFTTDDSIYNNDFTNDFMYNHIPFQRKKFRNIDNLINYKKYK